MARETLWACGKFLTAVDMLAEWLESKLGDGCRGLAEPLLVGFLETIWRHCNASGNPYLGAERIVERAAKWPGERGVLFRALLNCGEEGGAGFIELDPDRDGYRVHDYFDHAPEYVQRRAEREAARAAKGKTLSDLRREAGKKGRAAQLSKLANDGHTSDTCPAYAHGGQVSALPAPISQRPTPIPREEEGATPHTSGVLPFSPASSQGKGGKAGKRNTTAPLPDLPPSIDTPEMKAAWAERLQERREKGARGRLTPSQVASQFRDLETVAAVRGIAAAIACVERATSGGNQGVVFPEDKAPGGNGRGGGVDRQRPLAPGTTPEHVKHAQELDRAMGLIP